jgi:hypothetical protein
MELLVEFCDFIGVVLLFCMNLSLFNGDGKVVCELMLLSLVVWMF